MVLKLPECGCDQYLPRSVLNMLLPAVSSQPGTLLQLTVRSSRQLQREIECATCKPIFVLVLGRERRGGAHSGTVPLHVSYIDVAGSICVPLQIELALVQIPHAKPLGKRRLCRAAPGARGQ